MGVHAIKAIHALLCIKCPEGNLPVALGRSGEYTVRRSSRVVPAERTHRNVPGWRNW
jgi:hypothetical protein